MAKECTGLVPMVRATLALHGEAAAVVDIRRAVHRTPRGTGDHRVSSGDRTQRFAQYVGASAMMEHTAQRVTIRYPTIHESIRQISNYEL